NAVKRIFRYLNGKPYLGLSYPKDSPFDLAAYSDSDYAEVDSTKGLVDIVEVWYRILGKSMMLNVEYVWRPPIFEYCKIFGHTLKSCRAKDLIEEDKILKESMKSVKVAEVRVESNNVGWQAVGYRRNVHGRGGLNQDNLKNFLKSSSR
nr:hypothetical protein [Tanacetum cinerariifolium]